MRVVQVSVRKLFKRLDYVIPLNVDERITIIHGPNGSGKTILLRMLSGLFNAEYATFRKIPFSEFSVKFDDGSQLKVNKSISVEDGIVPSLTWSPTEGRQSIYQLPRLQRSEIGIPRSMITQLVPELERIGADYWRSLQTGEILNLSDVLDKYGELFPLRNRGQREDPEWLMELRSAVKIDLIRTDRLVSSRSAEPALRYERSVPAESEFFPQNTVTQSAIAISHRIQTILAEYAQESQSLDRTFPNRLLARQSMDKDTSISTDDLRERLAGLEAKRKRLISAGLLELEREESVTVPEQLDPFTQNVLIVYVEDTAQKLSKFDEILVKIETLQQIINNRFLYKTIRVTSKTGFAFETDTGDSLFATDLSSGEQHELILLYRLLFGITSDTLILIDEPEISLHIAWQQEFLKDLRKITELGGFDVLIATHAPDIINDKWEWTVDLGEQA